MSAIRSAEIIAVGSELLTPHRTDTNSLFISGRLNDLGIEVRAKAIVGDDLDDLAAILRQALARADLVVITGGLGPTEDDITREAVSAVLERPLSEDAGLITTLEARFADRGFAMPANNRKQAQVPHGAVVLPNPKGSAPGLWIEHGNRAVAVLPGPPRELQPMFDAGVAPRLAAATAGRRVRRRTIKITGRAESQVDEVARDIYLPLQQAAVPVQTTILATPGQIELHLMATGGNLAAVDAALDAAAAALATALAPFVFSIDGRSLEAVVGDLLVARRLRIAVAESCTAGLVLGRLTNVPGSSAWVVGGIVAYDNEVKVTQLGVSREVLAAHGAVSEPVASAMAEGVRLRLGADVGVGLTGIAGPTGGSPEKPVGTVVVAVSGPAAVARTFKFPGDRHMVRQFSTAAALDLVRRALTTP
jgi:nicotinamide-nucleotide amidase